MELAGAGCELGRVLHSVFKWEHKVIIWAGKVCYTKVPYPGDTLQMFNPVTDQWKAMKCTGTHPKSKVSNATQVVGDQLYMIDYLDNAVHTFNLSTFHWQQVERCGDLSPIESFMTDSCAWQGKIYTFGGCGRLDGYKFQLPEHAQVSYDYNVRHDRSLCVNNQCVAFDTATRRWEWPRCSSPPSPRAGYKCVVSGDHVLLFGGENFTHGNLGDLHALHLPSHTWRPLAQRSPADQWPKARSFHSLTMIGERRAVLYGGQHRRKILSDAWLLTWALGRAGIEAVTWRLLLPTGRQPRWLHEAVYSPETARLYILGGHDHINFDEANDSRQGSFSIRLRPATLREACSRALSRKKEDGHKLPSRGV